jgi:hypothetical protein
MSGVEIGGKNENSDVVELLWKRNEVEVAMVCCSDVLKTWVLMLPA